MPRKFSKLKIFHSQTNNFNIFSNFQENCLLKKFHHRIEFYVVAILRNKFSELAIILRSFHSHDMQYLCKGYCWIFHVKAITFILMNNFYILFSIRDKYFFEDKHSKLWYNNNFEFTKYNLHRSSKLKKIQSQIHLIVIWFCTHTFSWVSIYAIFNG